MKYLSEFDLYMVIVFIGYLFYAKILFFFFKVDARR